MNPRRTALFWGSAMLALIVVLVLVSDILLPFVFGAGIAYLLDPVADRMERWGLSRLWASLLILIAFSVVLLLVLVAVVPVLMEQMAGLAAQLPDYLVRLRKVIEEAGQDWMLQGTQTDIGLEAAAREIAQRAPSLIGRVLQGLWSGGLALVNVLALFLVTPLVAFYLLKDWDRMLAHLDQWTPRPHADTVRRLAHEIDMVVSGFVRGQVIVLVLLALIYVVGLMLIGLNFGLLIGLVAGLVSFVPYLGPMTGFLIGGVVAVVQFWPDWVPIAAVLGVFAVGQFIEGNILSPLIVGDRVRLHPVWLIFALFAFGYLFGFVGLLLAVPLAAAIGVLVRFALHCYLESPLYKGAGSDAPLQE